MTQPTRLFKNTLGIHALVWTGSWAEDELDRAMALSAEIGYEVIEIPRFDPTKVNADWFRKRLDAHGLDVVISVSRDLDARLLGGILFSALGKYPSGPTAKGREHAIASLRKAADKAESLGLPMALELVNRYESNLINTTEQGLAVLNEVGSSHLGLHLDTYHMNIEEANTADAIRQAGDRLGYFHVGDSHRGYAGTGQIDFAPIFSALIDIDYQGMITFESFSSEVLDEGLSNDIAIWRNTWSDSEPLARHAYDFMIEHLNSAERRHRTQTGQAI